jgi:hypothetical protein
MSAKLAAVVILILGAGSAVAKSGNHQLFCTAMRHGHFNVSSCFQGTKIRTDLSKKLDGKEHLLSSWIIDVDRGWSWMVDHKSRTYRSVSLRSGATELRRRNKKGFAEAVRRQKTVNTALAKASIISGRSKWNKDAGKGCASWHRFSEVTFGREKQKPGDICIRRWPKGTVASYLTFVQLLKQARQKMQPLELQGLPVPNLVLPIYLSDGVIRAGHLPAMYVTSSFPKKMVFGYGFRSVPRRYFLPPGAFKKK